MQQSHKQSEDKTIHNNEDRIINLDMLRGLAVLGILWINIIVFGLPSGGYALPSYIGDAVSINIGMWAISELFVDGAMRGLFSCMFGASALIYLSETKLSHTGILRVEYFYRRNMYLILIGILHAYLLIWPFEILYAYGLLGLFLFPLRKLSSPALVISGCILLIAGELVILPDKPTTDDEIPGKTSSVSNKEENNDRNNYADNYRKAYIINMEEDIELHKSSYPALFLHNINQVMEQQSVHMYGTNFYDIGGMMLIGMALLKLGILQGNRSRKFYLRLMLTGFLVSTAMRAPGIYHELANQFLPDDPENPGKLYYDFSRLPLMLGYIGLFYWLLKFEYFNRLFTPLMAVGKVALTNYIMQTIICVFLFYGFGLGLIGFFERYQLLLICVLIWFIQIVFSNQWLKYYRLGPLEWLWRSAVYAKWLPLRIKQNR